MIHLSASPAASPGADDVIGADDGLTGVDDDVIGVPPALDAAVNSDGSLRKCCRNLTVSAAIVSVSTAAAAAAEHGRCSARDVCCWASALASIEPLITVGCHAEYGAHTL